MVLYQSIGYLTVNRALRWKIDLGTHDNKGGKTSIDNIDLGLQHPHIHDKATGLQIEVVLAYFTHLRRQKCIGDDVEDFKIGS
jgi:hypothetical protein